MYRYNYVTFDTFLHITHPICFKKFEFFFEPRTLTLNHKWYWL